MTDVSPPTPDSAAAAAPISSLIRDKDLVPTLDIPPEQLFASESENSDSEAVSLFAVSLLKYDHSVQMG